ncbi:C40 family peptidase [Micromonospora sp. NBC_01813]|uniref:C40 family peptidase n=1 Tax=Micromonospora sp. NBC_01813 TaxID=2975988 RepID=UPI002DDAA6DD|nr:NlpC/P60 family protein [Micromonospora sp. NBC_01813]WSA11975.1 NlpC/P60 family protein [Micromonospora sp. NBC_01813]
MSSARILLRTLVLAGVTVGLAVPASAVSAQPSVSELTQQINKESEELVKVVESYNRLNEEAKATRAAAEEIDTKLAPLQEELAQAEIEVGQIAITAYKTGGLSTASALLDGTSDTFVHRLGTLDHLARDRQQRLSSFTDTQVTYLAEQEKLQAALAKQDAQVAELADRKEKIEAEIDELMEKREDAYGAASQAGSSYSGPVPSVAGAAGTAVEFAYGAIGKPYVWGSSGPNGYDCSGLMLAAWRAAGKSLPHNAAMQWDRVAKINRSALQPGDLVFYNGLAHVALYVGNGQVIHAPTFGRPVELAGVDMMAPYGFGRVT